MSRKRNDAVWNEFYAPFMGRGRVANNPTNNRQDVLERMYRRVLGELAMNRFEWTGFEGTGVDVRYLEMMLYFHALSVVFKDENERDENGNITKIGTDQIFALRGNPAGVKNLVDNPTHFTVTGSNFTGKRISAAKCVPIWANYLRSPDLDIVGIYATKLAEVDRTIEINTKNARRTKVLVHNENTRLTAKNVNDMIDRGEATVPVNFQLGDMVTALDLGVDPRTLEPLSILRARLWNECMGLLGINNANQDKKERLVEAEVGANEDQVNTSRRVNLNARQEAAEKINNMFGLNVSVDYYSKLPTETVDPATNDTATGGA